VKTGERVKGGASIIAEVPESELAVGVTNQRETASASVEPEFEAGDEA
jgi:hypothetical protein